MCFLPHFFCCWSPGIIPWNCFSSLPFPKICLWTSHSYISTQLLETLLVTKTHPFPVLLFGISHSKFILYIPSFFYPTQLFFFADFWILFGKTTTKHTNFNLSQKGPNLFFQPNFSTAVLREKEFLQGRGGYHVVGALGRLVHEGLHRGGALQGGGGLGQAHLGPTPNGHAELGHQVLKKHMVKLLMLKRNKNN